MEKFITFKEQELKDNLEWIESYTKLILSVSELKIRPSVKEAKIKRAAESILKQIKDFKLT